MFNLSDLGGIGSLGYEVDVKLYIGSGEFELVQTVGPFVSLGMAHAWLDSSHYRQQTALLWKMPFGRGLPYWAFIRPLPGLEDVCNAVLQKE